MMPHSLGLSFCWNGQRPDVRSTQHLCQTYTTRRQLLLLLSCMHRRSRSKWAGSRLKTLLLRLFITWLTAAVAAAAAMSLACSNHRKACPPHALPSVITTSENWPHRHLPVMKHYRAETCLIYSEHHRKKRIQQIVSNLIQGWR